MALQTPRIQFWPFRKAPARLQALFREGKDTDWVASVPKPMADFTESSFLRWRQLHPVSSARLPNGRIVYWGAPRESITVIAELFPQPDLVASTDKERRVGARVPLTCTTWYETGPAGRKKAGTGRIIDMSTSGVSFTTETLLRKGCRVELHIAWPVQLEGDVPVELFASGKVIRAESNRASLRYDHITFRIAPTTRTTPAKLAGSAIA